MNIIQDCFTQSNFFQVRLRRLLLLLLPSLEFILRDRDSARISLILGSKPDWRRDGEAVLKASSGARCERAERVACNSIGRVAARVKPGVGASWLSVGVVVAVAAMNDGLRMVPADIID